MFRLVAVFVLLVFGALVVTDAVCCPDGCTDTEQTSQSHATEHPSDAGTCLQCLGGIDAPFTYLLASFGKVSDDVVRLASVLPDNVTPDPVEHPPRS